MDLQQHLARALAGRFRLGPALGQGGTAVVYGATSEEGGAPIAIKVLHPDLARAIAARRFLREIALLHRLDHPGIVPCLASGSVEVGLGLEVPWLAMPCRGPGTLRGRLREAPRRPRAEVGHLGRGLCEALMHAHERGVLHRDLTPANVLLHEGNAQVTDFGVARAITIAGGERLSSTGIVVGSPSYMSPEQARGEEALGPASDGYSLGAVLYEMLAGEPVFPGRTPQAVAARHQREAALDVRLLRPDAPASMAAVIAGLLAKRPEDRPGLGMVAQALGAGA